MTIFKLKNSDKLDKTFDNPFDLMTYLLDNFNVEISEIEGQDNFVKSDFYKNYANVLSGINIGRS